MNSKHKFFKLGLALQHDGEGIDDNTLTDMHMELIDVFEKYNFSVGGGLKPTDENGDDLK